MPRKPVKSILEIGSVYGRLTVEAFLREERGPREIVRIYRLRCDCGQIVEKSGLDVSRGRRKSCGCLVHENRPPIKHGGTGTRLHQCWRRMRDRCKNPKATGHHRYGGRGITVCEEWQVFARFREWALANGYTDALSIDRVNGDGNYEPSNCRWIPAEENARISSGCRWVDAFGERKIIADWLEDVRCQVPRHVLKYRLKRGWPAETALTTPPEPRKKQIATRDLHS